MGEKIETASPKFFCENCGNEVKRNTKVCPHCGRFFASVKCPKCNFVGMPEQFRGGCPSCGYAVKSESSIFAGERRKSINNKQKNKFTSDINEDPLPWWVYSIVMGLFVLLIVYIVMRH